MPVKLPARLAIVSRAQVGLRVKRWKGTAFYAGIGLVKPFDLVAQVWKGWKGHLNPPLAFHAHKLASERKGGKVASFEQ